MPGLSRAEDCESLFARIRNEKTIVKRYAARHPSGNQQALGNGELCDVYRIPAPVNRAGSTATVKGDMVPFLRLLKSVSVLAHFARCGR